VGKPAKIGRVSNTCSPHCISFPSIKCFILGLLFYVRFDVGPILQQELYEIPKNCSADELGATLAVVGSRMVISTT